MAGRFAPSPTGDLHLGNLRTALVAWLAARSSGSGFLVRIEDLDRVASSREHEERQLSDLSALGLDHDGTVVRQSERFDAYHTAIAELVHMDLVYPCYCTRREIAAEIAASVAAPHASPKVIDTTGHGEPGLMVPDGAYPGTCRELTRAERAEREELGRPPALRLRGGGPPVEFHDAVAGPVAGAVDDVVLRRGDGVPAYNLAVVVDDAAQGVTQVVRGDDLLSSTPRQIRLQRLLGLPTPSYLHLPLVLGDDGERVAKRHGAVTLRDLGTHGVGPVEVLRSLAASLELPSAEEAATAGDLLAALDGHFDPARVPKRPVSISTLTGGFRAPDRTDRSSQG